MAVWSIFSLADCLCRNFLLTSMYWHWFRWMYFCKLETRSKIHQVPKLWLKLALKIFFAPIHHEHMHSCVQDGNVSRWKPLAKVMNKWLWHKRIWINDIFNEKSSTQWLLTSTQKCSSMTYGKLSLVQLISRVINTLTVSAILGRTWLLLLNPKPQIPTFKNQSAFAA